MSLPVIATNWSGPTEYLTEESGYPLRVDELEAVGGTGYNSDHRWASIDVGRLSQLMRDVAFDLSEAQRRGAEARRTMEQRYSPETMSGEVERLLEALG